MNGARAGRERESRAEAEGAAAREGDRHLWRVHPTPGSSQCLWLGALAGRGRPPASGPGSSARVVRAAWPFCASPSVVLPGGGSGERGPRGREPINAPPALHLTCHPGEGRLRDPWLLGLSVPVGRLCWAPGNTEGRPRLAQWPEGEMSRRTGGSGSNSPASGELTSMVRLTHGA